MTALALYLFTAAALAIVAVFVGTLLPAVPRIVAILRGRGL